MFQTKIIVVVLLLGCWALMLVGGCQSLTRDEEQQVRKYSTISNLQRRMLVDDIDRLLFLERPSRLSQWHIPTK